MVYFHGGGLAGNVFYNGGEYLLDENVILVTLHYRLGVFGKANIFVHARFLKSDAAMHGRTLNSKPFDTNRVLKSVVLFDAYAYASIGLGLA